MESNSIKIDSFFIEKMQRNLKQIDEINDKLEEYLELSAVEPHKYLSQELWVKMNDNSGADIILYNNFAKDYSFLLAFKEYQLLHEKIKGGFKDENEESRYNDLRTLMMIINVGATNKIMTADNMSPDVLLQGNSLITKLQRTNELLWEIHNNSCVLNVMEWMRSFEGEKNSLLLKVFKELNFSSAVEAENSIRGKYEETRKKYYYEDSITDDEIKAFVGEENLGLLTLIDITEVNQNFLLHSNANKLDVYKFFIKKGIFLEEKDRVKAYISSNVFGVELIDKPLSNKDRFSDEINEWMMDDAFAINYKFISSKEVDKEKIKTAILETATKEAISYMKAIKENRLYSDYGDTAIFMERLIRVINMGVMDFKKDFRDMVGNSYALRSNMTETFDNNKVKKGSAHL